MLDKIEGLFGTRFSFYAIAALIVLVGVFWIIWSYQVSELKGQLAGESAQVSQLQGVNATNTTSMAALQKQHAADVAALADKATADAARATETTTLNDRIDNAKPTDDGDLAPVLRNLLISLRGKAPAGGPIPDGKTGSATAAP